MSRDRPAEEILPSLPDFLQSKEGDKFSADLIGAEIVGFGTTGSV